MPSHSQLNDDFAASLENWMPKADAFLVAVSGGLDSMVLLHFLHRSGYRAITVVHVDHQLRGDESTADAGLVAEVAEELGLPLELVRVDVAGRARRESVSLELAARELRYESLAAVAEKQGCSRVVTAHHADDQVETVLINYFRGSGQRGLSGMKPVTHRRDLTIDVLRPLLPVRRKELAQYAAEHGVRFRHDQSNDEDFALRNRIRKTLIPTLHDVFGRDVTGAILRGAELASREESWMNSVTGELPRKGNGLDVAMLRDMAAARRDRLLLRWLREAAVPDCGFDEVSKLAELALSDDRPARINLPGAVHARRRAGVLFLEKNGEVIS